MGTHYIIFFFCDSGGIDAAAMLYCVFPLESSAKRNKKAVLSTAIFVISATFCEQVPTVADTTKATLASGFLVALCARDSGGGESMACLSQTLKALWKFCNYALTRHSQHTFITCYCCSSSAVNSKPLAKLLIFI